MLQQESLSFMSDLKNNNNRDWFLENKKRYEAFKKDYHQLVKYFLDYLKPLDSSLELLEIKNCTFRINRDIRFSKDKSPYKTHLSIWLSGGSKNLNRAGYYLQIQQDQSFIAGGLYCPEPTDLKKIRNEIAYFHEDLDAVIQEKNFKNIFEDLDFEESNMLKNAPKNFDKDHVAVKYLKLKSFTTTFSFDTKMVLEKDFVQKTGSKLIALKPFNDFLNRGLSSDDN